MKAEERIREGIFKVEKPWGNFKQFTLNTQCTVKILTVKARGILSKQSHRYRDELWVALDDGLKVELNDRTIWPRKGEEIIIPKGAVHRLSAPEKEGRMLEISFGVFDEEDIVRYEDAYGRVDE
ncbi:MAG: phosphomannose isomerase type II C-terminal cupin domain [bacterium]